jgi:hypothetical protein
MKGMRKKKQPEFGASFALRVFVGLNAPFFWGKTCFSASDNK